MKIIANVSSGEIIEREMTDLEIKAEIAEQKIWAVENAKYQAELETKATAKAALLARLGITEEEAKLLLS